MNEKLSKIIDISEKVLDCYMEIAYFLVQKEKSYDFFNRLNELKDLLMIEELAYEKFIMENDRETVYEIALKEDFKENDEVLNTIEERISSKMYKKLFCATEATNMAVEELRHRMYIPDDVLNSLRKTIEKQATQIEFSFSEPAAEVSRNYITFVNAELEKNQDPRMKIRLATALMLEVYKNGDIEEELVKKSFHIDGDWIRINNVIGLTEDELIQYKHNLFEFSRNEMETYLSDAYSVIWDKEENTDYLKLLLRCKIRSVLYSLENMALDDMKNNITKIADKYQKNNPEGTMILKQALLESQEDRKIYPKLSMPLEESKTEQIETKIYNLYQELIKLKIRHYNGEDVDFDIESVLVNLKVRKDEEMEIFKEQLQNKLKIHPLTGIKSMSFCFDNVIPEIANRTISVTHFLTPYIILRKHGVSEEKADLVISTPDFIELYKNILFFFDDAIKNEVPSVRDYLIKCKYDYIFQNKGLEEVVITSNFQVSKDDLVFPDVFMKNQDYVDALNEKIIEIINEELSTLLMEDLLGDSKDLNKLFTKTLIFIRGCLYTLDETKYQNIINELQQTIFEPNTHTALTRTLTTMAINYSRQDRTAYPKLIFINDKNKQL